MTNEQINEAIAKLKGWTKINELDKGYGLPPDFTNKTDYLGRPIKNYPVWEIPDFCNDLNLMHELERTMGDPQLWVEYQSYLSDAMGHVGWVYHATAAERAESFLKTIGKWEGGPQ